jgi:hypothetical protein
VKNCLDKAIGRIPACDQVTKLDELDELAILHNTLVIITILTLHHGSKIGIAAVGGVEVVVKIMKTFPKCEALQEMAGNALNNLANCSIGKAKVIESGGIEVHLAAIHNHLGSAIICTDACWALHNIVKESKENTGLLISLGGATAVAKVRTKWPDNNDVQFSARTLANLIAEEMKVWADEE